VLPLVADAPALYVTTGGGGWMEQALVEHAGAREPDAFVAAGGRWAARMFWVDGMASGRSRSSGAGGAPLPVDDLAVIDGLDVISGRAPGDGVAVEVTWRLVRPPRELAMAQLLRASTPPDGVVLSEAQILPTDARPEDGAALMRLVFVQRFAIAAPSAPERIAFRLVTRWGRRPLTSAVTLGTLSAPPGSPPRLDRAP
jgi:hypothetical protein